MSRLGVSWPGYAPWTDTVLACRNEFTRVARSFWLIPELIPPVARDDIALLYCFCRRLDDAVDEATSRNQARDALRLFRDELGGKALPRPLVAALLAGASRSGLPLENTTHLLDGMDSDLGEVRMPDDAALLRYSYRVSSSVGLMLAPLLGIFGKEAERRVIDLGIGLQLSNVLLGVESDARLGRVYLPETRLRAQWLGAEDVLEHPKQRRLAPVLRGIVELADRYYASAEHGVAFVPIRYRHGVLLLGRAYGALARKAAREGSAPATPAGLPTVARYFHLLDLALTGMHPRVLGLRAPPPHDASLHRALHGLPGAHE
jgi:phytoene synthase